MREILFKAKRLDNGEWVEGCLIKHEFENRFYIGYVFEDMQDGFFDTDLVRVDPETVCQFTGFTDYNGIKIFESDKLSFVTEFNSYKIFHTVYWDNNCSQFLVKDSEFGFLDTLDVVSLRRCVVIGNIHDKEETNNEN